MTGAEVASAGRLQQTRSPRRASAEGELSIVLGADSVSIRSSRPLSASRILLGKTPQQALQFVPLLFSVCASAQTRACHLALQAASSEHLMPAAVHPLLCQLELLREGLLRILRAPALGQPPPAAALQAALAGSMRLDRQLRALIEQGRGQGEGQDAVLEVIAQLEQLLASSLFGDTGENFAHCDKADDILDWIQQCRCDAAVQAALLLDTQMADRCDSAESCPPLPTLELAEIACRLLDADREQFVAWPQWQGRCHETGTFARYWQHPVIQQLRERFGNGLLTRRVATLLELARVPQRLRESLQPTACPELSGRQLGLSEQSGIAVVEAARGSLVHLVTLSEGLISDYRILAPTEWNFHPRGPVACALESLASELPQRRELLAHHLVQAVDPCVGYQLELR